MRCQSEFLAAALGAIADVFDTDMDDFEGLWSPVRHGVVWGVPKAVARETAAVGVVANVGIVTGGRGPALETGDQSDIDE